MYTKYLTVGDLPESFMQVVMREFVPYSVALGRARDNKAESLPPSFVGVSGGPVWGMQLQEDKNGGQIKIKDSALIGITFYQSTKVNNKRRLRAHFIKSIYELAWKKVGQ
jgi:hypothetical protein